MKFTDGYWQVREGVKPYYPAHVYDVEVRTGRHDCFCSDDQDNHTSGYT